MTAAALPAVSPAVSRRQLRAFLCTNFIYVWLVLGWSLTLYPLGIDFVYLADASGMQPAIGRVFHMEMRLFGETLWQYRAFNILLLYCCMVCILLLTRFVLDGPWWLGSLAAVLTMANPAKSEGVLHLSAVADLLPAFAGLAALAMFAAWHRHRNIVVYLLSLVLLAFATLGFAENLFLPVVALLLYAFVSTGLMAPHSQLMPVALIGVAGVWLHGWVFLRGFDPVSAFAPLYLAYYPLGLLPTTAAIFFQYPFLWLAVLCGVAFAAGLCFRVTRNPVVLFGILAALVYRAAPMGEFDFVHLRGAGSLLIPLALLYISFAAVWMHVQRHPRWRRAAVLFTTLLCVLFFALQVQALRHWREAGALVKAFQARAALSVEEAKGEEVGIAPDFRYHHTAPVALYASVLTDTLFSKALPVRTTLAMNYFPPGKGEVNIIEWNSFGATFEITGATLAELFGPDLATHKVGDAVDYDLYQLEIQAIEAGRVVVKVYPLESFLPDRVIPLRNRGDVLSLSVESSQP